MLPWSVGLFEALGVGFEGGAVLGVALAVVGLVVCWVFVPYVRLLARLLEPIVAVSLWPAFWVSGWLTAPWVHLVCGVADQVVCLPVGPLGQKGVRGCLVSLAGMVPLRSVVGLLAVRHLVSLLVPMEVLMSLGMVAFWGLAFVLPVVASLVIFLAVVILLVVGPWAAWWLGRGWRSLLLPGWPAVRC